MILTARPAPARADVVTLKVVQVIDGDTFRADLAGTVEKIRVRGMDAPERGEHAGCPAEAALAERATSYLADLLRQGPVTVETGRRDRWKRILGVVRVSGRDVAPAMIKAGLARPYRGGPRQSWCG